MSYPVTLNDHNLPTYLHTDYQGHKWNYVFCRYHDKSSVFPINMHKHDFYEINIITAGHGRHYIEQTSYDTVIGAVYAVPPGIKHGYWCEDDSLVIFHMLISDAFMQRYKADLSLLHGFSLLFEIEPSLRPNAKAPSFLILNEENLQQVQSEINTLIALEERNFHNREVLKNAKALYVISLLCNLIYDKYHDAPKQEHAESIYIAQTMMYVRDHYQENIGIDRLAEIACMAKSTYLRHFQSMCKCSPTQYLLRIRLEKAAALLHNEPFISVTTVAQECGFFDCSHFIKNFRKIYGMTPLQYKTSISKN